MKIAFFVHGYLPWDVYGVPRYIECLADYMVNKGHTVTVFCVGRPGLARKSEISGNAKVYRSWFFRLPRFLDKFVSIWSLTLYTVWCIIAVPKLIKKEKIDLVHGHTFEYGGIQSLFVSAITRRKCLVTYHGTHLSNNRLKKFLQKFIFNRSSMLVCLNKEVSETLVNVGFPRAKLLLIQNYCVDTSKLKPKPITTSKKTLNVLFVGRLNSFKAPDLFVKAASIVLMKKKDVEFWVIGHGGMRKNLEALVSQFKLTQNVHLLGSKTEFEKWYSQSDIYVACSPYENLPSLSLLEAMALGLAIVATNVGETSTLIENRKTGLLAEATAEDVADKILLLVKNSALRESLGHHARIAIEPKGVMALGKDYERIYSKLLQSDT